MASKKIDGLSAKTWNCLNLWVEKLFAERGEVFERSGDLRDNANQIATLTDKELKSIPGAGRFVIDELDEWLEAAGHGRKKQKDSAATIKAAITVLERNGYTVSATKRPS